MVYRSPEPVKIGQQTPFGGMSDEEWQRYVEGQRTAAGVDYAVQATGQELPPTPFIPDTSIRQPEQGFFKKAGIGALKGLVAGQEIGGGLLRMGLQGLTPGEQGVEREFKKQKEGNFFQRVRKASKADEGFEWDTPFEKVGITVGGKFIKLLPSTVTGRGVAEVVGDPLNVVALVPFVGAPIRAVEMAALGAVKGAVGGVATGVARTAAQRTAGGVLKAAARTGPGAIMDVAEEAVKGAAKSFDFERRIIGRAKGTGVPKPSGAAVGEPELGVPKTPDIEFSPGGSKATRKAELDAIQKTTDNTIEGLVRPFDAARGSRFGRWAMGTESQGFRQLFGNTKIGRAFNERVNGLRGIVRSSGADMFAKVGEKLHLHNIMESRGLQQTGFKARLFELKEKAANMLYDDDGFMQNVLHRGGQVVTDAGGTLKGRTHSLSIMENIFYDPVQKKIGVLNREGKGIRKYHVVQVGEGKGKKRITETMSTTVNEDKSVTLRFGGKYKGNEIRLSREQKEVLEDTLTYLHDAGKHAFRKEIIIIKRNRAVMGKIAQRFGKKRDAVTEDDILKAIGENDDFLFKTFAGKTKWKKYGSNYFLNLERGRGLARGANYVTRILREAAEANESLSDAARILAHDQGRVVGGRQRMERVRNEFADQFLNAGKISGHYVVRPSELVEAYSKGAIKKAAQDDLNSALKAILLSKTYGKLSKADYAAKIKEAWGRKAEKAAGRKVTLTEAQGFVFEAEEKATGKLLIRQLGIGRGEDAKAALLKWVNEQFFAPLRGFRAGIDLGFMGINTLPMLFIDPVGYGKVWGRVIKTFGRKDKYLEFMNLKSDVISDMTETGIHMSSYGADLYDSLLRPGNSAGILGKIPLGIGNALERTATKVLTPFEQSFYTAVDAARISLFEFYTPIWGSLDGPARLAARRQMADFINYSTGGFSTVEAGLTPTQRDIESSWVFFSPRYTRASLGLVSLVFDGSVQGAEARRLLANALTAGTMIYINACESLGVEPNLDPTSGEFFTIPIGGDSVGPGTFYRQLLTLNARMIENPEALYFADDKPGVQFGEKLFNHPIVKFFRGRTPIGTGFAIDMATGSDYLGHELDGWEEKVQHAATLGVPFWAENMIQGDPYKAGPAGVVSEMLGARSFPRNPFARRRDMRDELAQDNFNKEQWGDGSWNSLTKAQQEIIEAGSPELRTLDEEVKESKGDRSGGFDTLMEEKFDMIDEVNEEYHRVMVDKILAIESGETPDSLPELWELNQEQQRRKRREKQKMRKDERFIEIDNYYEQLRKEGKIVDQFPDEIMQDYYYPEVIWATERNDGSVDWAARQRLKERFFSAYPGMEAYVNTLQHSWGLYDEDTPAAIREGHTYMEKYGEKYFDFTADAVFNTSVSLQKFRPQYEEFRGLNSKDRDIVLSSDYKTEVIRTDRGDIAFDVYYMKEIRKRVNEIQMAVRQGDEELDRWVFRWGIEGSRRVYHPSNIELFNIDRQGAGPAGMAKSSRFRLLNYDISTSELRQDFEPSQPLNVENR